MTESMERSWATHGPLTVSPDGRYLAHEDGTRFFWLGDTAWRLTTLSPSDVDRYFDIRSSQGFNVVHINATSWAIRNFADRLPFLGDGPTWTEFRPDEGYWAHVDHIFEAAESRGIFVQLSPWWGLHANGDPGRQFFADPDTDNRAFGRYLGERYGARPNLLWCVSGEYQRPYTETRPLPMPGDYLRRHEAVALGMREGESFRHPMTIHPNGLYSSSEDFHQSEWLDFNTIQSHKGFDYIDHLLDDDWNLEPPKPVLSSEGWYEAEPSMYDLSAWEVIDQSWLQRFQAYWSVFHGSIGYTYGHGQVWMMRDGSEIQGTLPTDALNSPSAACLIHLRHLFERWVPSSWSPSRSLITGSSRGSDFGRFYGTSPNLNCAILADDRSWAMVYSTRGMNIHLRTSHLLEGEARFSWFNPRTGLWRGETGETRQPRWESNSVACGLPDSSHWFFPPGGEEDSNDWMLLLCLDSARFQ